MFCGRFNMSLFLISMAMVILTVLAPNPDACNENKCDNSDGPCDCYVCVPPVVYNYPQLPQQARTAAGTDFVAQGAPFLTIPSMWCRPPKLNGVKAEARIYGGGKLDKLTRRQYRQIWNHYNNLGRMVSGSTNPCLGNQRRNVYVFCRYDKARKESILPNNNKFNSLFFESDSLMVILGFMVILFVLICSFVFGLSFGYMIPNGIKYFYNK